MARKLLSLVVALAMVLSSMSFAFAAKADPKAVSADVTDAKVKKAVEKLVTLGMVEGIDGKFVPDQKLKRSELTKLVVIALGMGPAADASKGVATQFSDVGADHWAAGYITVAAGQGLVQGMGDGTFAPDSEITFAQALTMLVRALGYKDEFLKGSWPGNYLAKASEKDLDEGVTIVPNAAVKRGDFAVMMSNTLDAEVVKINGYENDTVKYTEDTDTTLAKEKLKLDKAEVRLTGNARLSGIAVDEVKGIFTKDCADDSEIKFSDEGAVKKGRDAGGTFTLEFEEGLNPELFLGMTSNIYVKDKDTIVYIEDAGTSTVYWDGVDKFQGISENSVEKPDLKLRWAGKVIPVKGGEYARDAAGKEDDDFATLYYTKGGTTKEWNQVDGKASAFLLGQDYGRVVVENGKVVFADMFRYENLDNGYMVKEVDAEDKAITYYESDDENTIDLDSKYSSYKMYLNGQEITIKDVKPFDVFYISEAKVDSKDVGYVFVFRKVVEGTLTAVIEEDGAATKIELDSKTITDIGKAMSYSLDNNKEIEAGGGSDEYQDFVDTKVTLVIDNNKKIKHMYGQTVASDNMYGVITGMFKTEGEYKLKLYTSNDEEKSYYFEEEGDADVFDTDVAYIKDLSNTTSVNTLAKLFAAVNTADTSYDWDGSTVGGDANDLLSETDFDNSRIMVKFKLTKDGEIAENSLALYKAPKNGTGYVVNGDFGDETIQINSKSYIVKDNVKVFDIDKDLTVEKFSIGIWDNFKDRDVDNNSGRAFAITNKKGDVEALFLLDGMDGLTVNVQAAYLINAYRNADNDLFGTFQVYGTEGTIKKEIDNSSALNNITKKTEAAVMINLKSSGKVEIYDNALDRVTALAWGGAALWQTSANYAEDQNGNTENWKTVAGRVYDIQSKKLQIGTDTADYYTVDSKAVIYQKDKVATYNDIDENDFVVAIVKSGTIQAIELLDIEKRNDNVAVSTSKSKATVALESGYYVANADAEGDVGYEFMDIAGDRVAVVVPLDQSRH